MCTFYIMPLIYTKILLCINGEALFFNRIYLRWYTQHYPISLRFAQIFFPMEQQKKNTAIYWILFLLSTVALIVAINRHFEYLTLILPFFCTFFVKALDIM